jgi:hypothetical protein
MSVQRPSAPGQDNERSAGVAPAEEAFVDEALDCLLGHATLIPAPGLPKQYRAGAVAPQRGRRQRKDLVIGHRQTAPLMRQAEEIRRLRERERRFVARRPGGRRSSEVASPFAMTPDEILEEL